MAAATELSLRVVKMEGEEGAEARCEKEKDVSGETIDDDDAKPSPSSPAADDAQENDSELNAYELERERNIARNHARMEAVVGKELIRRTRRTMNSATSVGKSTPSTRRPRPRPSSSPSARTMPTRSSRRLSKTSPSPPPPPLERAGGTRGDRSLVSRSSKPVIPSRFVRGVQAAAGAGADAEALRELNEFRASYMSRAALFNRVMAVSNLLKLEDFAAVLGKEEGTRDLAALAREKIALMKLGDPRAVREFVMRSKEIEHARREREREKEEEEEVAKAEGEEGE